MTRLAECYQKELGCGLDTELAVLWYAQAAERGDREAQYELGALFAVGQGVPQSHKEALFWFKKAASQGDPDAQYRLGVCYEEGLGVGRDVEKAATWYTKAAWGGDREAQYRFVQLDVGAMPLQPKESYPTPSRVHSPPSSPELSSGGGVHALGASRGTQEEVVLKEAKRSQRCC